MGISKSCLCIPVSRATRPRDQKKKTTGSGEMNHVTRVKELETQIAGAIEIVRSQAFIKR